MSETYKVLAQGEVPTDSTAIYTCATANGAIVKHIKFVNQTAGALTITVWVNGNTDPYLWLPATTEIPANGSAEWEGSLAIANTNTIKADAPSANDISYIISGVELA